MRWTLKIYKQKQLPDGEQLHIYDLASRYFVNNRTASTATLADLEIYPTRVDEHYINVHINNKNVKGNLQLTIFDMSGKNVINHNMSVKSGILDQKVELKSLTNGAYIVSIADESGKVILNKKILVTE
ncbi:T9SS type A sorting domain-containing protein [Chryseobacterium sp. P1-3]|uniref:T9SS type A sorting domain-containing protein n=1 Tax=Chryseobacterium sp. (strain P1-3) TaxID=1517683 RepID=UPI000A5F629C|nr:T9SS type A sorting domain-containing protein [Chryseobacterium sp. P1-3]